MKSCTVCEPQSLTEVGLEACDEIQLQTRSRALNFFRRRAVFLELLEDGVCRLLELSQRMTWPWCHGNFENASVFVAILARSNRSGGLLIEDEAFRQSRRSGTGGDGVKDLERETVLIVASDCWPHNVQS